MKDKRGSKVIKIDDAKRMRRNARKPCGKGKSLVKSVEEYLTKMEVAFYEDDGSFLIKCELANFMMDVLITVSERAEESFLDFYSLGFLRTRLKSGNTNLRKEDVFNLALRLNAKYRLIKFYVTRNHFLEANLEKEVGREILSYESFHSLLAYFMSLLDDLYPKFIVNLFDETVTKLDP